MNRIITITTFLFLTLQVFGQDYKYVNTETLNIREGAGKEYNVIGQVNKNDKVNTLTESDSWTQIETETGLTGFIATKYLSSTADETKSSDKKDSSLFSILVVLGIIGYGLYKIKNFFSGLFGGSSTPTRERRTEKPKPKPKQKYICKHCGYENENLGTLTFFSCQRSPTKKHQPLEGGVKEIYSCKHCGYQNKNLGTLTFFSCHRSPTGKHHPLS